MKQFLFISLMLVAVAASAQDAPFPDTDSLKRYIDKWVWNTPVHSYPAVLKPHVVREGVPTDTVMLKIILSNKTSVHFYRKGLKRGDKYWYYDGRRIKPLPVNWFVFDYRYIKQ
jgi:hypothetical protein